MKREHFFKKTNNKKQKKKRQREKLTVCEKQQSKTETKAKKAFFAWSNDRSGQRCVSYPA
jgi:hypothetical protein